MRGSHENGDIFFQHREACNAHLRRAAGRGGRVHAEGEREARAPTTSCSTTTAPPDADRVIVAMGSHLRRGRRGNRLPERPAARRWAWLRCACTGRSSPERFVEALPKTVKKIAVLDRTKEPGAIGEPLYHGRGARAGGGRASPASPWWAAATAWAPRTPRPRRCSPCTRSLSKEQPQPSVHHRHRGRRDPPLAAEEKPAPITSAPGTIECKFWGLGGDGTVGANKNSIKIIGDHTDKYVQAYFQYDSKKTGGVTISHLRFGDSPIRSPYYVNQADFVACHNPSYITKGFRIVQDVKPGGVFLINCQWTPEELDQHLDAASKRYIAENGVKLYTINAIDLAAQDRHGQAHQHHPAVRLLQPGRRHAAGRCHQLHEGRRHQKLPEEGRRTSWT